MYATDLERIVEQYQLYYNLEEITDEDTNTEKEEKVSVSLKEGTSQVEFIVNKLVSD